MLVVNAGSSSLKLALLEEDSAGGEDRVVAERELEAPRASVDAHELAQALRSPLAEADAVGHRIVHGGERHSAAVIDQPVRAELDELTSLAPLHQPKSLAALDAVARALPDVPAVACFDTAFHHTLAPAASTYALPSSWRERWNLRRYGFHGLSHAHVARRVSELCGSQARVVSAHLGAGASLCAIADGRSVDTTMGFTPLEGLVMATRSGTVDPGLLLWLLERGELDAAQIGHALEHDSGLQGLAGESDMRAVLHGAKAGEPRCRLALDVYVHRLCASTAAMAAALGGLDVLVFTGGVGERAPQLRAAAAANLAFLGVSLDMDANESAEDGADIGTGRASVRVLVLRAREDLEIARQTRAALRETG